MARRGVGKNNGFGRAIAFIGLGLCMGLCPLPSASAVDTQVGARVCGSNPSGALIDITQPVDDSVVNQSSVTFRGTVASASQIVIEVDGAYDGTLAIAANQTTFDTNISFPLGTHTVSMRAIEVCGGPDGTDSVVLTYEPAVEPSAGTDTDTSVDPQVTGAGVVITDDIIKEGDTVTQIEQLPVIGAAVSVVSDFAAAIGLESTVIGNNTPAIAGVARVGITVAALTSVVMATSLAPLAAQAIPGVSEAFNVSSHRSMLYLGWIIRGVGVLAMAFAYFL